MGPPLPLQTQDHDADAEAEAEAEADVDASASSRTKAAVHRSNVPLRRSAAGALGGTKEHNEDSTVRRVHKRKDAAGPVPVLPVFFG